MRGVRDVEGCAEAGGEELALAADVEEGLAFAAAAA